MEQFCNQWRLLQAPCRDREIKSSTLNKQVCLTCTRDPFEEAASAPPNWCAFFRLCISCWADSNIMTLSESNWAACNNNSKEGMVQTQQLLLSCSDEVSRVLTESSARNSAPFALGAHCNLQCGVCKRLQEDWGLFFNTKYRQLRYGGVNESKRQDFN